MKRNLFFVGITMLVAAGPAWSQAAGLAEISGSVRDNSGAVVPGASVVISNSSKGIRLSLSTSGGGIFDAPALQPASGYDVTVNKQGFAEYAVKDITLDVGQNLNIVASLTVAGSATRVDVQGAATLVDDTKVDVSQVVDTRQIMELPINARRVDSFVLLTPGVTNDGNYGLLTFRGVANGNTFLLDGNDSTEQFYGENNGRTRVISQISQDAVQEFQVVSANFSAQYGNAMGGVVNTITKSGSNDLHASAYWFYRDQSMIAHDPYANIKPDEWRLQAGFSLGGKIIKDKLFYFLNGEFSRRDYPIVDSYIKAGIVDPVNQVFIGCGAPATPAQCSAINALLPRFFGLVPRTMAQDIGLARLDYHLNDRNTLSASLNYMHFNAPNGLQNTLISSTSGAGVNSNGDDYSRVRNGKFDWTSVITPSLVFEFRYGWNTDLEGDNLNPALNGALGLLDVSAAGVTLGAINYLPRVEPNETRNEFGYNLSWVKARHAVKIGYDFNTTNDFSYFIQNKNGSYTYQTVTAFAQDYSGNTTGAKNWQSYSQTFGDPSLNTRINQHGMFAQDEWKVTPKLSATIGLRYEYSQLPQPKICNQVWTGTCHINSPANQIMPRIGLAYRLNDKTVLRAGYGIFYSRVMGATLQDLFENNGAYTQSISLSSTQAAQKAQGPVFPNILPAGGAYPTTLQFAAPNWKIPYSEQGIFAVEREVMHDIGITASYIWSRGVQLYSARDLNLPALGSTTYTYTIADQNGNPTGQTFTTPVYTGSRPNPAFGAVIQDENGVTSSYNAATLQVNKRFSHGLQALASYTWSHEFDDGQGYGQATQNIFLSNANAWLYNGNYKADVGNGLEDQRHRFVVSWVWAPVFTHSTSGFARYVVNNWQLSSITTINSGRPYASPTVRLTDTPVPGMFSNFNLNGSGLSGRVPFWAVNSVYQPANYRADFRLTKIIPFAERYRLFLNFEVFNISNSWSPTSMTTQAYTEAKGVLTLTPTAYNVGSGDTTAPDGTAARRLQVSARFTF
jgi:Carboxypeptidase regulatory-like domain/TonB dependent receptor/TonB-dependent Receptor Plug Domain